MTERLPLERRRRPPTILVVDDSEDAQEWFRDSLATAGYRVLQAFNGRDALDILVEHATPAAIIVDLLMPIMDGYELMDVLRSYTRLARVPVVVVSAVDGQIALRSPDTRFLKKPVEQEDLLGELEDLLGGSPQGTR